MNIRNEHQSLGFLRRPPLDGPRHPIIHPEQLLLAILALLAIREDQREGAQDMLEVRAGQAVEVRHQPIDLVPQLLALGGVARALRGLPRLAHHLLPQIGELRAGAGQPRRPRHDGVEVGVARGEAGQRELIQIKRTTA
ncbi:MAG: hypothetical protein JXB30_15050 [Anaerolineae bacterium]|nr:hypothetical protein [Anaerolineae bacterium]